MELEKVPHYAKLSSPVFPNNAALRQPVGGGGVNVFTLSFVAHFRTCYTQTLVELISL